MNNAHKWLVSLGLAFLSGVIAAALDEKATAATYVRNGLLAMGPSVVSLRMTLDKPEGKT